MQEAEIPTQYYPDQVLSAKATEFKNGTLQEVKYLNLFANVWAPWNWGPQEVKKFVDFLMDPNCPLGIKAQEKGASRNKWFEKLTVYRAREWLREFAGAKNNYTH